MLASSNDNVIYEVLGQRALIRPGLVWMPDSPITFPIAGPTSSCSDPVADPLLNHVLIKVGGFRKLPIRGS